MTTISRRSGQTISATAFHYDYEDKDDDDNCCEHNNNDDDSESDDNNCDSSHGDDNYSCYGEAAEMVSQIICVASSYYSDYKGSDGTNRYESEDDDDNGQENNNNNNYDISSHGDD